MLVVLRTCVKCRLLYIWKGIGVTWHKSFLIKQLQNQVINGLAGRKEREVSCSELSLSGDQLDCRGVIYSVCVSVQSVTVFTKIILLRTVILHGLFLAIDLPRLSSIDYTICKKEMKSSTNPVQWMVRNIWSWMCSCQIQLFNKNLIVSRETDSLWLMSPVSKQRTILTAYSCIYHINTHHSILKHWYLFYC